MVRRRRPDPAALCCGDGGGSAARRHLAGTVGDDDRLRAIGKSIGRTEVASAAAASSRQLLRRVWRLATRERTDEGDESVAVA